MRPEAPTDRQTVYALLTEHTKGENLIRHCLAVEAALRAYARKYGEDEALWGAVGLIHDFDYEKHPSLEEHPMVGCGILRNLGWPETAIRAILSHSDQSGVARVSRLEKALYAVDELTGFITAVALVRPSRSLDDLSAKSVRKKMKTKAFAAAVDREQLLAGAAVLGEDFDAHVDFVIRAMRPIGSELGFESQA
ncbi:MAG: HAD family hydrolase [Candidatus Glassbacteria bacterium RIFCSPLOWO2_12_FULL_58_11]|uniref:HAD family hydrolase n=1 Tax=Candidatus Glassbacteria bacterium RIFCSPLOWO2_12_FULL_58_11 TaxID=1817867 RepID=A0A1F5YJT5_9BACT|nr:MAG: HAD family hydrolase [Candidatus Glassbacteria bacterium RIFCSPLOWO2_12_FULL_58_11]